MGRQEIIHDFELGFLGKCLSEKPRKRINMKLISESGLWRSEVEGTA
jgi:hypothetical protein